MGEWHGVACGWHVGGVWVAWVGGMWMACGWCVWMACKDKHVWLSRVAFKHALEAGLSLASGQLRKEGEVSSWEDGAVWAVVPSAPPGHSPP